MLEGMYSAAAGMVAQQQRLDALSNDIANVDTVGYQRQRVAFRDLVYNASGPGGRRGTLEGAGAALTTIGRGNAGASVKTTGQPLDVAIDGNGYLQVRQANGQPALTRNGALTQDAQGRLLADGLPLQPPVTIPAGTDVSKVTITANGTVNDGTRTIGQISLTTVRSPDRLRSIGGNLKVATAASGPAVRAGANAQLRQGALETSDVDLGDAMTDMMAAQQDYSFASRAISVQDQMAQIANQVKAS
jgi:flagellar basal-body rod protein FlgG